MIAVLGQMGALIMCGVVWRIIRPSGLNADLTRQVLTTLVFDLLLPALVVDVLWRAEIGIEALKISVFGFAVIIFGALLAWLISLCWRIEHRRLGAAMLGIAFPNVTYLGLPVLEQTFGPWTRALVIQIDLFAATPLVLTLGVMLSRHYGAAAKAEPMWRSLLKNPPLWAALAALSLNLCGVAMPAWLLQILDRMAAAVIPLMLIALGLGLRWDSWKWRNLPLCGLVLALKLAVMPLFGYGLGLGLGFSGDRLTALVMEAGMPSMLLGIVYCDRYRLDSGFYAMVVTLSTLCAIISLPFWHGATSLLKA